MRSYFLCHLGFAEGNFALVLEGAHAGLYGQVYKSACVVCSSGWVCMCVCVLCCMSRVWLVGGSVQQVCVSGFVSFMIFMMYS